LPFYLGHLGRRQLDVCGDHQRVDLVRSTEPDDRRVDSALAERPCDRDRTWCGLVALGDNLETLDHREVLTQLGLPEPRVAPAPVVVGQGGDSLSRHLARQQIRRHWQVRDHADALRRLRRPVPPLVHRHAPLNDRFVEEIVDLMLGGVSA
jgi:hypothetical protein